MSAHDRRKSHRRKDPGPRDSRLRAIFEAEPECVKLITADGVLVDMNAAGLAMIEVEALDHVQGRSVFPLVVPEYREVFKAFLGRVAEGDPETLEFEIVGLRGTRRLVESRAVPFRETKGGPSVVLSITHDITEQRKAENALRLGERRLLSQQAALITLAREESLHTGNFARALKIITETAAKTSQVERVSVWFYTADYSAIELHDLYSRSESRHEGGARLAASDYRGYFMALAEESEAIAAENAHTDPRTREFSASYLTPLGIGAMLDAPIRLRGKVVGVLCQEHVGGPRIWSQEEKTFACSLATMVTLALEGKERKQLEEELRQAHKMEAIGRLAGGIAHDFNNLVTIINGYSSQLEAHPLLDPTLSRQARAIRHAGERAAALTGQLLTFGRRQVVQPKVLNLNDVIARMEPLLRRLIGEHIDQTMAFEPELGSIKADPGQVEQMIMNLAINARDAMPNGGTLTMATANVELRSSEAIRPPGLPSGRYTCLTVKDTGEGLDEDTKARIFEPFFTTKEQGKGTGLGLAMVYGFVQQSGGAITVDSEPGQGASFTILFPHVDEPVESDADVSRPAWLPGDAETILLVEDEPEVLQFMSEGLRQGGYTVLEAHHGAEALTVAESHPAINLLITDVVMPRMSGRELGERLQARQPALKVLYVSGYTDDIVLRQGVMVAAQDFLHKPFSHERLMEKVQEVLATH